VTTKAELCNRLEADMAKAKSRGYTASVELVLADVLRDVRALDDVQEREPQTQPDLVKAAEAAPLLGRSKRWLYKYADTLPFAMRFPDGAVRFSRRGIDEYVRGRAA
jgi:predicted DNA-binding transcriptional regulator AlpA